MANIQIDDFVLLFRHIKRKSFLIKGATSPNLSVQDKSEALASFTFCETASSKYIKPRSWLKFNRYKTESKASPSKATSNNKKQKLTNPKQTGDRTAHYQEHRR